MPNSATQEVIKHGEPYVDALRKHVPTKIFGLYVASEAIIKMVGDSGAQIGMAWAMFGLLLIALPLWMIFFDKNKDWKQILFASISFVILIVTLGGPFELTFDDKNNILPAVGALLALIFTAIVFPLVARATSKQT